MPREQLREAFKRVMSTTALQQILDADDAEYLSINYAQTGECYAIASIDEEGDEIAVYEGHDLTPAARLEAEDLPKRPEPPYGALAWPYTEEDE